MWGGFSLGLREAVHFREKLAGTMDRGAWQPRSLGSAGLCKEVAFWQLVRALSAPFLSHPLTQGTGFHPLKIVK